MTRSRSSSGTSASAPRPTPWPRSIESKKEIAATGPTALRPLHLISFERDLDPLILAARHASHFPHLRHGAPHGLLNKGRWGHASSLIDWQLLRGDFLEHLEAAPAPDLIYFDPFSSKTDTALWHTDVFCADPPALSVGAAELLYLCGRHGGARGFVARRFYVAEGVGTGPKATTTVAFTRRDGCRPGSRCTATPRRGMAHPLGGAATPSIPPDSTQSSGGGGTAHRAPSPVHEP